MDKLMSLKGWMEEKGIAKGDALEEATDPRVQLVYARLMFEQNRESIDEDLVVNLKSFLKQDHVSSLCPQEKMGVLVASAYAAAYPTNS